MESKKLEQWITKREIQKHANREQKKYKGRKSFSQSLIIDLEKPRNQKEKILFSFMNKYK